MARFAATPSAELTVMGARVARERAGACPAFKSQQRTRRSGELAAADACSVASVEVLADAILSTHSFIALWMLRQPWEDRSVDPPRSWSALQLCEARAARLGRFQLIKTLHLSKD